MCNKNYWFVTIIKTIPKLNFWFILVLKDYSNLVSTCHQWNIEILYYNIFLQKNLNRGKKCEFFLNKKSDEREMMF